MKKHDLIAKLSARSSGPKGSTFQKKPSAGPHRSALIHNVAMMAAVRQQLLETLDKLTKEEFSKVKRNLSDFSPRLEFTTQTAEVVDEMMETFGQQSVKMIKDLLIEINRKDLAENMQDTEETSTSVDSVDCGSVEDSSSWTKVDPELDGTSPDEDPTYSLQSAAGHFECSVSGLRWVCREKVGFRYRFCSWVGHMERMESRGYRPAGPLLDISVLTGKVMEVQLPHWVCTDDVPELLKNFAVLHVGDCGDVLEKATRVTKTHVGLTEPVFSLLGALRNLFFSPRIICNTLIYYQPKTSYLKMHVYLIPPDPALKQSVHRRESSKGYEEIMKPRPDKPLKMDRGFSLQATVETARIQPPEITLRPDSQDPNFYEVFIESPDENFNLELLQTHSEKVWFCEIRKDDHPKSGSTGGGGCSTETVTVKKEVFFCFSSEEHFVDKHRETLIQRVRNVEPVLDGLLQNKVLMEETYDRIRSLPTSEAQLREIFSCLRAADECKDIFLSILQEKEPHLITDLQRKC
ncbi:NACHT, LRR and PYD domains-containing protein 1b allele 5-like isoform X3 [Poeciliopsis prolifica]|uniref:NACHT, LRR and PYD domains-containing protein 1b allele 5-like isoform X3 n=1 Tax=Poeciliopsis prolifica TaxID=188132 RepID=UPI0024146508|nr:NACHT, LRR and PYD domains-containing protein 1b allele 5-like isoform X3 [Poeciliopsis prolifica]